MESKQTNKKTKNIGMGPYWHGKESCEEETGQVYTARLILGTLILGTFPLLSGKSAEIDWLESPGVWLTPGNHGREILHIHSCHLVAISTLKCPLGKATMLNG